MDTAHIQLLRGTPLTLLVVIFVLGGSARTGELVEESGYSKPTVIAGLKKLNKLDYITRNGLGWHLTDGGKQLPLAWGKESLPDDVGKLRELENKSLKDKTTTGKESLLLKGAGIQNPTRDILLSLPHITEEYLEAHISQWKQERGVGVGVLINRLRENMPAPKSHNDYTGGDFADFIEH